MQLTNNSREIEFALASVQLAQWKKLRGMAERGLLCSKNSNDLLGEPAGFEIRWLALIWNPIGLPGGSLGFSLPSESGKDKPDDMRRISRCHFCVTTSCGPAGEKPSR